LLIVQDIDLVTMELS